MKNTLQLLVLIVVLSLSLQETFHEDQKAQKVQKVQKVQKSQKSQKSQNPMSNQRSKKKFSFFNTSVFKPITNLLGLGDNKNKNKGSSIANLLGLGGSKPKNKEEQNCPNPFVKITLEELVMKQSDYKEVTDQSKTVETLKVEFKTKKSIDGIANMCQYTIYCDNVYTQNYEAFLQAKELTPKQKEQKQQSKQIVDEVKQQEQQAEVDVQKNSRFMKQQLNQMDSTKTNSYRRLKATNQKMQSIVGQTSNIKKAIEIQYQKIDKLNKIKPNSDKVVDAVSKARSEVNGQIMRLKKQQIHLGERARRLAAKEKKPCEQCDLEFTFPQEPIQGVQIMKENNGQFYYSNEIHVPKEDFSGMFNDRSDKPPKLKMTECYISFEPSDLIKAGENYGDMSYGEPVDYFKDAKFIMLGYDMKIIFDLENRKYLPEMKKIKNSVASNACDEYCEIQPQIDIDQVSEDLINDSVYSYFYKDLTEFEEDFNKNYLKEIKIFLKSPMAIYKIDKYCVKLLKGIRFIQFFEDKQVNRAVSGFLNDLYEGGELNSARLGIMYGFRTKNIETMIKVDRQCMINKIFGKSMDE